MTDTLAKQNFARKFDTPITSRVLEDGEVLTTKIYGTRNEIASLTTVASVVAPSKGYSSFVAKLNDILTEKKNNYDYHQDILNFLYSKSKTLMDTGLAPITLYKMQETDVLDMYCEVVQAQLSHYPIFFRKNNLILNIPSFNSRFEQRESMGIHRLDLKAYINLPKDIEKKFLNNNGQITEGGFFSPKFDEADFDTKKHIKNPGYVMDRSHAYLRLDYLTTFDKDNNIEQFNRLCDNIYDFHESWKVLDVALKTRIGQKYIAD